MLSFLFLPYLNKSVRLHYLLGFNNTIIGKMLYLYNPSIYNLLYYSNKTIVDEVDKVDEDSIKSKPENIEKPKRKLNAYQIFIKDNYNKIKNENPFLNSKEIMTELGREWNENKKKLL